ncbi:MAG: 50S ribosomal protein L17 [Candidatus Taylorbacteria bacterium]|nr:50S ribosomal protein L17 [Candidatus Taylorbacteria bacterium]
MKHHSKIRKFGREKNQRNALMLSLARSLVLKKRITTTLAKAKELRPFIEKAVTKAKKGTLASRRLLISDLHDTEVAEILVKEIAPSFKERAGGYTRIVKLPRRNHDAAFMALIEFVK